MRREGPAAIAAAMGPKLFAPGVSADSPNYRAAMRIMQETPVEGIRDALFAMADREDMRPYLTQVQIPTLVLAGEQDQIFPLDRAQELAANIPTATLVKVPDAGHMPMLEQPAAVNAALDAWLERVY